MKEDFLYFTWAWLPWATFQARDKIQTDADAKRFLIEAWDARQAGQFASEFGKAWK
jgi:hypothetical protein